MRYISIFLGAFDSVVHAKLLYKLYNLDFPSKLISWIEFFSTSLLQVVIIENNISSTTVVLSEVPQGSVLGPLLFILYVDDIESILSESITFKLFADYLYSSLDTNFHHSHLQEAINSVVAWSVTWQLPINFPKCSSFDIVANNPLYTYYLNRLRVPCQTPRPIWVLIVNTVYLIGFLVFWPPHNQVDFKKGLRCSHAIYSVRSAIGGYVAGGLTDNVCALDLSKAFDRMNHFALFIKLMNTNTPVNILAVIEKWFAISVTSVI